MSARAVPQRGKTKKVPLTPWGNTVNPEAAAVRARAKPAREPAPLPPVTAEPILFELPMPPSANELWAFYRGKRPTLTPKYRAWKREVAWELRLQARCRIEGAYSLHMSVPEARADLDNSIKAVNDALQKSKVIANDRLCRRVVLERDPLHRPRTVVVTVSPFTNAPDRGEAETLVSAACTAGASIPLRQAAE